MTHHCTADNTDLVNELVLHKNGYARNDTCTPYLNNTAILSTKNYQNWLINAEDIASQTTSFSGHIQHD